MPSNPPLIQGNPSDIWSNITLRDLFAAFASHAILRDPQLHPDTTHQMIADIAYQHADALLAQREDDD
ncbi:unnamed protein product [marine sediment metagenome]|uniref:Uncharacterized protein n=1 Tax=marine sediment metagenome TaxID=412755 RepID=X0Y7K6_9ZZZZ